MRAKTKLLIFKCIELDDNDDEHGVQTVSATITFDSSLDDIHPYYIAFLKSMQYPTEIVEASLIEGLNEEEARERIFREAEPKNCCGGGCCSESGD